MSCVRSPVLLYYFRTLFYLFWVLIPLGNLQQPDSEPPMARTKDLPSCHPPQTPSALPSLVPGLNDQITLKNILMASAMVLDKSLDDVCSRCSAPTMSDRSADHFREETEYPPSSSRWWCCQGCYHRPDRRSGRHTARGFCPCNTGVFARQRPRRENHRVQPPHGRERSSSQGLSSKFPSLTI